MGQRLRDRKGSQEGVRRCTGKRHAAFATKGDGRGILPATGRTFHVVPPFLLDTPVSSCASPHLLRSFQQRVKSRHENLDKARLISANRAHGSLGMPLKRDENGEVDRCRSKGVKIGPERECKRWTSFLQVCFAFRCARQERDAKIPSDGFGGEMCSPTLPASDRLSSMQIRGSGGAFPRRYLSREAMGRAREYSWHQLTRSSGRIAP